MDIVIKTVLDFIQSNKGYENSVIAGGSVRDFQLDLEPRDYDFFVPVDKKNTSVRDILSKLHTEFKINGYKEKGKDYDGAQLISGVNEFVFEGKIIDVIGKSLPNDDQFGATVVQDFDYGLNMAFYTGLYVDDTNEKYQSDFNRHRMTLHNLESMAHLPRAMERFVNFQERAKQRGFSFRFDSSVLSLKRPKVVKPQAIKTTLDTFIDNVMAEPGWIDARIDALAARPNRVGVPDPVPAARIPNWAEIPIDILRRVGGVEEIFRNRDIARDNAVMHNGVQNEVFFRDPNRFENIQRIVFNDGVHMDFAVGDFN